MKDLQSEDKEDSPKRSKGPVPNVLARERLAICEAASAHGPPDPAGHFVERPEEGHLLLHNYLFYGIQPTYHVSIQVAFSNRIILPQPPFSVSNLFP